MQRVLQRLQILYWVVNSLHSKVRRVPFFRTIDKEPRRVPDPIVLTELISGIYRVFSLRDPEQIFAETSVASDRLVVVLYTSLFLTAIPLSGSDQHFLSNAGFDFSVLSHK